MKSERDVDAYLTRHPSESARQEELEKQHRKSHHREARRKLPPKIAWFETLQLRKYERKQPESYV